MAGTIAAILSILTVLEQLLQAATGSNLTVLSQGLMLLKGNEDIITLVVDAATGGKLTKAEVLAAVDKAITEAYDAKVRAEMGLPVLP